MPEEGAAKGERISGNQMLHDRKNQKKYIYTGIGALIILSLLVRIKLISFQSEDYMVFISPWYNFIKVNGIQSFKYEFSNYNAPYLYFLFLSTLLPISKIVAIKGLLIIFDIFLASAAYFVVKFFRPKGFDALLSALAVMFIPTVLVNGVMWGQCDQLYVGCFLYSFYFGLKNKSRWSWIWFGFAIAIKLQAIFFLPVLVLMCFSRIRWYDIGWGISAFLIVTLLPLLEGRSLLSLINIYPDQINVYSEHLVLNAPTLYQWFPNITFQYLNTFATEFTLALVIFFVILSVVRNKLTDRDILIATSLVLYFVPFFLPAMHERYFFPAGIVSWLLFFCYPNALFILITVTMQVITLLSYSPFLFHSKPPIPFGILSFLVLLIITALTVVYFNLGQNSTKNLVRHGEV